MTTPGNDHRTTPSEEPYVPSQDPDSDPDMLASRHELQPSQAEGDDVPEEDGEQ